jgi:hypothetical protein
MNNSELVTTASVLLAIFALAGGANQLLNLWRNLFREQKPPAGELQGQVTALAQRMDKQEEETLEAERRRKYLHERIEEAKDLFGEKIDDTRKEIMTEVGHVHERVNQVLAAVSKLEGRISK